MHAMCKPVAYDKSIYEQKDGTFLLVVREDDNWINIPCRTLEEAQAVSDYLPPDPGEQGEAWYEWALYKVLRGLGWLEEGGADAEA